MNKMRVNLATEVVTTAVRKEQRSGRDVLIVPSKTLPDNIIMNGVLYPADEIAKSFHTLEGTFAPLGHPQVDGQYVNAANPLAINGFHIGAHNENVRQIDGVVHLDKVIDIDAASRTEQGLRVLNTIEKGEPIHTSTGLEFEPEDAPKGASYKLIARKMNFDHDCILLDVPGAATPAQGVGMMVNALLENSTVMRRAELTAALRLLNPLGEGWYWLRDEDDTTVIFEFEAKGTAGGIEYATEYTIGDDGVLVLSSDIYPVRQVTTWERMKSAIVKLVTPTVATTATNSEAVKMTPEELKAQLDAHMEGVKTLLAANAAEVGEKLTAVNSALDKLGEASRLQADKTTAANRAIVSSKLGELIANALEGDALADMAAKCQADGGVLPQVGANSAALANTLPE